jgi:hypothetical protein
MNEIGTEHLAREAIVYVRQSTVGQVINKVDAIASKNMSSRSGRLLSYPLPEACHRITGHSLAMPKPDGIE